MTKLKGDIAEQAVIFHSLKRGYGVLQPIGDRMPYDLVLDVGTIWSRCRSKAHGGIRREPPTSLTLVEPRRIDGR